MKRFNFLIIMLLIFITTSTCLIADDDKDLKKHPGYVNFDEIDIPKDAEETVEVYVRGPLLRLIAKATEHEDPGVSEILEKLLLIRVNTFSIDAGQADNLKPKISKIEKDLEKQKWEKVVRVKEREELVNIYMKLDDKDRIVGLVVMAIEDGDEAVFVNIVGETDWEAIGKIGRKLDIDEFRYFSEDDSPRKRRK